MYINLWSPLLMTRSLSRARQPLSWVNLLSFTCRLQVKIGSINLFKKSLKKSLKTRFAQISLAAPKIWVAQNFLGAGAAAHSPTPPPTPSCPHGQYKFRLADRKTCFYFPNPDSIEHTVLEGIVTESFYSEALINNYWMWLSMISWIIKTEVCVTCRSRRLRQITRTWGFDNSWYYAKTEFNNCFIIHFSHNSSSETEVKCSAILFLRRPPLVHKLLWIDWMLSTNQIFHSESDV